MQQRDDADQQREVAPADPRDEEARDERGAVDERRAEVGLLEDERDRDRREPERLQHDARVVQPPDAVGEEAREREHEQQLPELGRLELERPDLDPALRAARGVGEREDEQHPDERQSVDPFLRAAVVVGVDREGEQEAGEAEADRDRLTDDVVVLVALDVEARDPGHGPEPVRDDRPDGEQEDPVEPAQEAEDVEVLARGLTGRVLNHSRPPPGRRPARGTSARRPSAPPEPRPSRRGRRSRSRRRRRSASACRRGS